MLNWVTSKIRTEESVRSLFCFVLVSPISFTKVDVTGEKGDRGFKGVRFWFE